MVKKLATSLGVLVLSSSFAFAAQNNGAQPYGQGSRATTPSTSSATKTTPSPTKHHKKHHKRAKKAATTTAQPSTAQPVK